MNLPAGNTGHVSCVFVFVKGRDFFIGGEGQLYGKAGAAATGALSCSHRLVAVWIVKLISF